MHLRVIVRTIVRIWPVTFRFLPLLIESISATIATTTTSPTSTTTTATLLEMSSSSTATTTVASAVVVVVVIPSTIVRYPVAATVGIVWWSIGEWIPQQIIRRWHGIARDFADYLLLILLNLAAELFEYAPISTASRTSVVHAKGIIILLATVLP